MIGIFTSVIPLLSAFLSGFGSWLPYLIAFGFCMAVPAILKEVVSYV